MKGHHSTAQRIIKSNVNAPTREEKYLMMKEAQGPRMYLHTKILVRTHARLLGYMADQGDDGLGDTVNWILTNFLDTHERNKAK